MTEQLTNDIILLAEAIIQASPSQAGNNAIVLDILAGLTEMEVENISQVPFKVYNTWYTGSASKPSSIRAYKTDPINFYHSIISVNINGKSLSLSYNPNEYSLAFRKGDGPVRWMNQIIPNVKGFILQGELTADDETDQVSLYLTRIISTL